MSLSLLAGCGHRGLPAADTLPGLDPAAASALADPRSSAARAFLAATGSDRLAAIRETLLPVRIEGGKESARAGAVIDALDAELDTARGLPTYRDESQYLAALPAGTARDVLAMRRRAEAAFADTDMPPADKLARVAALRDSLRQRGDACGVVQAWAQLAMLEHRLGHTERAEECRRKWIHHAARAGRLAEQSRAYSQLLMGRLATGWSPAERDTLATLIERARRARLARASSSLLGMVAYDAFTTGQIFTARTVFHDAIDVGTELGDPTSTLPTMVTLMRMYARFECWDQMEAMRVRASQLLDETIGTAEPTVAQRLTLVQLRALEATGLAARGHAEPAHAMFSRNLADARTLPFEEATFACQQWVEAMIAGDRPDLAAIAVAAADSLAGSLDVPGARLRLPYWRAWLAWRRGDAAAAAHDLDAFAVAVAQAPPGAAGPMCPAQAMRARLEVNTDPGRAWATLLKGWRELQERLAAQDHGAETYLDLARNPHLRLAADDLAAGDAELSYGLDLLWRDAMRPGGRPLAGVGDLRTAAREQALAAQRRLADGDVAHCVYRIGHAGVTRWTAEAHRVTRDELATPVDTLRHRTTAVLAAMSADPGSVDTPMPTALAAELEALGEALLPGRLRGGADAPRLAAITGDGFLSQFPFAALGTGGGDRGGYAPLVAHTAVAWCRHGLAPIAAGKQVTLQAAGDAVLGVATRRRFALPNGLPGARDELAHVGALFPGHTAITGASVTAARVREVWDTADIFYFVGHAISDPSVSFATWLPLAEDAAAPAVYPGLGIQDILGARFRHCRVVVLSGCGTGRPYVDGLSTAPSLGDAFLDAGVGATVQTFWRVRDEGALVHPEQIVSAWGKGAGRGEGGLAIALAAEQRRALELPTGTRHPFAWAAWTVAMSGSETAGRGIGPERR